MSDSLVAKAAASWEGRCGVGTQDQLVRQDAFVDGFVAAAKGASANPPSHIENVTWGRTLERARTAYRDGYRQGRGFRMNRKKPVMTLTTNTEIDR